MDGLFFIIIAFLLMIAEAFIPSFGVLSLAGLASLLYGGHLVVEAGGLFGIPLGWGFFIGLATLCVIVMGLYAYVGAKYLRKQSITGVEGMIGQTAKIVEWSGKEGRVHVQGEIWSAHATHAHDYQAGDEVVISAVHDMVLHIHQKQ